jgi:hypothetical protein
MKIIVVGDYHLSVSHVTGIMNLQDIHLSCDTSQAPVNIYLPKISGLKNLNAIIHIDDTANNSSSNPITIYSAEGDLISGTTNKVIRYNSGNGVCRITSTKDWIFTSNTGNVFGEITLIGELTPTIIINSQSPSPINMLVSPFDRIVSLDFKKPKGKYIRNYFIIIDEAFIRIADRDRGLINGGGFYTASGGSDWFGWNGNYNSGIPYESIPSDFGLFEVKDAGIFLNNYNSHSVEETIYIGFNDIAYEYLYNQSSDVPQSEYLQQQYIISKGKASMYAVIEDYPKYYDSQSEQFGSGGGTLIIGDI